MNEIPDRVLELVSKHLDGDCTPDERAALERAMEESPELRTRVERAAAAEREIRASLAPAGAHAKRSPGRQFAVAAMLVLAVCAAWWFGVRANDGSVPVSAWEAHGLFVIDREPQVVCDTPEKFLAYTTDKFDERVTADFDGGPVLVGWRGLGASYGAGDAAGIEPRLLLALTEGDSPVVVLFQSARDPRPELDPRSGLRMFKQQFGGVTAWEITPEENAVVLPLLSRG